MKRITRLLAGPSGATRWRLPAAMALVLGTSIVFASQSRLLPQVQIASSTSQLALRPGDTRVITSTGLDGKREYKVEVGADGKMTETYRVDGKVVTIDERGRDWIDDVSHISVPPPPAPPAPPPPPAPPTLADMPLPPPPPAPPAPPKLSDSRDFQQILRLVSADPAVTQHVGNPVTVDVESINGSINLGGTAGDPGLAQLRLRLGGPKGRAIFDVVADQQHGEWQLATIRMRGVQP